MLKLKTIYFILNRTLVLIILYFQPFILGLRPIFGNFGLLVCIKFNFIFKKIDVYYSFHQDLKILLILLKAKWTLISELNRNLHKNLLYFSSIKILFLCTFFGGLSGTTNKI